MRLQRFAQASRAWLYGCAWQVGNIARRYKPVLDEYLTIRGLAVAGLPTFAMLEIANGLDVRPGRSSPRCGHSPRWRPWSPRSTTSGTASKEVYRRQIGEDVYSTIMREYDCKIYEAADLATAFRDRILQHQLDCTNLTVVSPDMGRVRVADIWSDKLGCPLAIIHKRRDPLVPNRVTVHDIVGDVPRAESASSSTT